MFHNPLPPQAVGGGRGSTPLSAVLGRPWYLRITPVLWSGRQGMDCELRKLRTEGRPWSSGFPWGLVTNADADSRPTHQKLHVSKLPR